MPYLCAVSLPLVLQGGSGSGGPSSCMRARLTNSSLLTQQAMAQGPPVRVLRQTPAQPAGCPRPEDLGMWHSRQGKDHLGGWFVQDDRNVP